MTSFRESRYVGKSLFADCLVGVSRGVEHSDLSVPRPSDVRDQDLAHPWDDLPTDLLPLARTTSFRVERRKESKFVEQCVFLMVTMVQIPAVTEFTFHRARDSGPEWVEYLIYENWQTGDQFHSERAQRERRTFDDAVRGFLIGRATEKLYWGNSK